MPKITDDKVQCSAEKPSVLTTFAEELVGSMVEVKLDRPPHSEAEADLVGDTFQTLYQSSPVLEENPPPSRAVNKALIEWMTKSAEYEQTKAVTQFSIPGSMLSTPIIWAGLTNDETIQDALKQQEQAQQQEEQAEQLEKQAAQQAMNGNIQAAEELVQQADLIRHQAQQTVAKAVESIQQMQETALGNGVMLAALNKASTDAQNANEFMRGWGMDPGSLTAEDSQLMLDYLKNSGKLAKELARLIGRLRGIANSAIATEKSQHFGIVSEPDMTKDVVRIFPTERAYLSGSVPNFLRAQKVTQLFSGGLIGWRPKVQGKQEGAMVCAVDRSGSMMGAPGKAAKALALAIARALIDDNDMEHRGYSMFLFESSQNFPRITHKDTWREHMAWAMSNETGGTNFDYAINQAIVEINLLADQGITSADLLFITDG